LSERRKYERRPYVKLLRYYLTAAHIDKLKVKKMQYKGISFDICERGIGMVTSDSLNEGDILYFRDNIKVDNFVANSGVVKWILKLKDTTYRLGLEFSDLRLKSHKRIALFNEH
jgi:c-di-GMP-binding flagellar brake protein YcgR